MKKTYSKPVINMVKLELTKMVALSTTEINATNSEVLSRESNDFSWDDED